MVAGVLSPRRRANHEGFTELEVGQQELLSLDRPRAIEILIQHTQHAQQEFFAAAS
jgi:hypothetical protein